MYKLICITDEHTADGFRLAGIDVRTADSPEKARVVLLEVLDADEAGIIALDARLAAAVDERLEKRLANVYRPLMILLPLGENADIKRLEQERLQRLIRRAVGFDVTLPRR